MKIKSRPTNTPGGGSENYSGMKILAHLGVPVRVWPRLPKNFILTIESNY